MHLGIAGEVRFVITRADGTVKNDTGYQKNLILNQGLDFFGGGKGSIINDYCAIGSGNSAPAITQTGLDSLVAIVQGINETSNYAYSDTTSHLYKMWTQKKYRFTNLDNVNVSEVGLVSNSASTSNYYLTTRALIKDAAGKPTSISVKLGETLDVFYKIHKVIDTTEKAYVVNLLDGDGGAVPYNIILKPACVGNKQYNDVPTYFNIYIGGSSSSSRTLVYVSPEELAEVTSMPTGGEKFEVANTLSHLPYELGSYKRTLKVSLGLDDGNQDVIRSLYTKESSSFGFVPLKFLPFQMRFGSVADDSPIRKTANDTLIIPLEFSWGRYEGDL